jgi:hypothetical protein
MLKLSPKEREKERLDKLNSLLYKQKEEEEEQQK